MEEQGQEEKVDVKAPEGTLRVVVDFELKTGVVKVSGHIDNTDICMKVLVEGAHLILQRNANKDIAKMAEKAENLRRATETFAKEKTNGTGDHPPLAAAN